MARKLLVREAKQIALTRLEDAARTVADFREVQRQWNVRDQSRMRKEGRHEIGRPNEEMLHWDRADENDEKGRLRSTFGAVIPRPLEHPWWRQLIQGDFIDAIYDNAEEMWQLVEDWGIASQLISLTAKQKDVIFLSAVRQCTPQQIACYQDKTDRAIRKLLTASLEKIREKLAPIIREQIKAELPDMTLKKRRFIEWYDKEKETLDNAKSDWYTS